MEILIVDDSESDAMIMEEAVAATGWDARIHNAWDGEQALAYLHQQAPFKGAPEPDLIILDLNMPRKGGLEVLEVLRAGPLARVPVMVLTTSHAESDILAAFEQGAAGYLTKPSGYSDIPQVAQEIGAFWAQYTGAA